jgi:hypothetical protein
MGLDVIDRVDDGLEGGRIFTRDHYQEVFLELDYKLDYRYRVRLQVVDERQIWPY